MGLIVAALILEPYACRPAWSQTIRMVVPASPGGAADILARAVGEQIRRMASQTVVIDNRPGGGTLIGTDAVRRAAPDGHTVLVSGPYLNLASHLRKLRFDPLSNFEPVCRLVSAPGIFAVRGSSNYRNFSEFIAAAKQHPDGMTVSGAGPGTVHQLGVAMLNRLTGVELRFIPYPGGAPAISALIGGHVTAVLAEYAPLAGQLEAGQLRALAVTSPARSPLLPKVQAVAETHEGYELDFWWGVLAPGKTAKQTVSRLVNLFSSAMTGSEVRAKLERQGLPPTLLCGDAFATFIRNEHRRYGRIVRDAKLAPE